MRSTDGRLGPVDFGVKTPTGIGRTSGSWDRSWTIRSDFHPWLARFVRTCCVLHPGCRRKNGFRPRTLRCTRLCNRWSGTSSSWSRPPTWRSGPLGFPTPWCSHPTRRQVGCQIDSQTFSRNWSRCLQMKRFSLGSLTQRKIRCPPVNRVDFAVRRCSLVTCAGTMRWTSCSPEPGLRPSGRSLMRRGAGSAGPTGVTTRTRTLRIGRTRGSADSWRRAPLD